MRDKLTRKSNSSGLRPGSLILLIFALSYLIAIISACSSKLSTPTLAPAPTAPPPAVKQGGKQLFLEKGCITCHRINGEGGDVGPSLVGISGRTVELTTGEKVNRTHDYLHESIIEPDAKVVKGYPAGIMPKTSVTADQLHELSEFIESLK